MNHKPDTKIRIIRLIITLLIILSSTTGGYWVGKNNQVNFIESKKANRKLNISAIVDYKIGFTNIKFKNSGDNFIGDISYYNLTDVSVNILQDSVDLEDAILEGLISLEEIFAYARLDAKAGFCSEKHESKNGLTAFIYEYPEYTLELTYDVYETPDAKQHLINDMKLYAKGSDIHTLYTDDKTGERIDKEDWGLHFEIEQIDSTSIILICSQSGGQQIGELEIESFNIIHAENWEYIPKLDPINSLFNPIAINMNSSTHFPIDWIDFYGSLESGNYYIILQIKDLYALDDVHPLTQNYYDTQYYQIPFSIP